MSHACRFRALSHRLLALAAGLFGVLLDVASAQEAPQNSDQAAVVRVEVNVTAVSGGSVYLDKGRNAHIEPGDLVAIRPLGGATVPAVVRIVSRSSARAELPAGATGVGIGDRAEVLVPEARLAAAAGSAADGTGKDGAVPEHPPWKQPLQEWDGQQPLLAPAYSVPEAELPMKVFGRFYTQWNGTWDTKYGNEFQFLRTGVNLTVENPFGSGGEVHLAGDLQHRQTILDNAPDDGTTLGRLDRASYLWGGTREAADRMEAGRFLQHTFPELGLLDGAEYAHRTDSGNLVGGSFGAMPEPFPDMKTGQDIQAAVFWRTDPARDAPVEYGVAYQNTWHQGAQDRNLFVGTFDARPSEDVTIFGDALVDYYGPGDTIKDGGLEVTEARLNGNWRLSKESGVGLHASQVRWPEMKRSEFADLTPEQLKNNEVTRFGADAWHDVTENLRVDGRADLWQDQDDAGSSGSVRAALRNVAWERGEVAVDLFMSAGSFTDGHGARLSANRAFESIGFGTLSWEVSQYSSSALGSENTNLVQQALRASLDSTLGNGWNMSLYTEHRFGDSQGSMSIGVFLQRRF